MARFFKQSRLLGAVLNLLGLTVAFSAFMVIMIQVLHDWRFDRNYPGSDRTFRLEFVQDPSNPGSYNVMINRPFIDALKGTIPEVEALGTYRGAEREPPSPPSTRTSPRTAAPRTE